MAGTVRVLFVEDSEDDCFLVARELSRAGILVEWERAQTRSGFLEALLSQSWQLILCDHSMPHFSSREALQILRERGLDVPFVIVSGTIGEEQAVEAMRAGASDYVLKGHLARLPQVVARELRESDNRRQRREVEVALRRSQEQLHHAQKMESMGRLAGGIAHDFNNLLTAILGFSRLALEDLTPDDPLRRDLDQVVLAAERAARLTGQLLAFCRREPSEPAVVNVNEMVQTLTPMLQRLLGAHVRVVTESDPDAPSVIADPGQLEQVLMNLAVNARDAMPGGGTLTMATKAASLDADRAAALALTEGRYTAIEVRDTGHGMDEETRNRAFEPFFTTKDAGKGTGLGLSMVYGVIKQSGGAVALETAPGDGTTFTVFLPAAASTDHGALDAPDRAGSVDGTETVLLVENDPLVRRLAVAVLDNAGYVVLEASDGDRAVELARTAGRMHLLLTNLIMPGGTGRDLGRIVGERHPGLRVLYMSGYASHEAMPADVLSDPGALLRKPFSPTALLSAVRARLDAPDIMAP